MAHRDGPAEMTTIGLLVIGWIAGALTTGLALLIWALIQDARHDQQQQQWHEDQLP